MNEKEAELIGMHVGDGTLYLSGKTLVWEMRGSTHEQGYYEYVSKILKDLFEVEVKPKFRGINSYGVQTCNKKITKFFIDNGFSPGSKVYTVSVPDYIKCANNKLKQAFVRGLFDTDGCVWFHKNRTPYAYYPHIEFNFASEYLVESLSALLTDLGFRLHKWKVIRKEISYKICMSGFANLEKWFRDISPSNSKHINRMKNGLLNKDKVKLKKCSTNL